MAYEIDYLASIVFFLSIFAFVDIYAPASWGLLSPFNYFTMIGTMVGVAGACSIFTGLACGLALGVATIAQAVGILATGNSFVQFFIFIPIQVIFAYLLVRISKGGG